MITEPELEPGPEPEGPPPDVLDGGGAGPHEPGPGESSRWMRSWTRQGTWRGTRHASGPAPRQDAPGSRRPGARGKVAWLWAVGGLLAGLAIGAGALLGAGFSRGHSPDLHGYRLRGDLCTGQHLQPLTDALAAQTLESDPGLTRQGTELGHSSCQLFGFTDAGDGWQSDYTVTVTVDLHKKSDPAAEFADAVHVAGFAPAPPGTYVPGGDGAVIRSFPGLGDRAYLTTSRSAQTLSVLRGGAVVTVSVDAAIDWVKQAAAPAAADGTPQRSRLGDSTALRPTLPATLRNVMRLLSQ